MLKKCRISKEGHPFHSLDIYANSQFESEESHHHQVLTPGPNHSILIISTEWEKLEAKHFFQPMTKTSIKHIIYFNCIHPSLLMCGWLGSIGLWILGLGEGLGFWLDRLYCETGRDHFSIFWWNYFRIATITSQIGIPNIVFLRFFTISISSIS